VVALVAAVAPWLAAPAALAEEVTRPEVLQIKLAWSNMFLIKSAKPVLIDGGSPKDMPAVTEALAKEGLALSDIALVILTHSHSDHAGMAAALQSAGIKIALGRGDLGMAQAGRNDDLKPTNAMGRLLKRFAIDPNFTSFAPDIIVKDSLDLTPWGIGGRAIVMPGHTPGSMVIILDDGRAFVGDMILGGYLGGAVFPDHAGEHYFQADRDANRRNIGTLLDWNVRTFYLGHGGPVTRESVRQAFGASGGAGAALRGRGEAAAEIAKP
jgi:glyoxylase-like metal-dependent hydrolase (beta-lactamase superfamily II)